VKEYWKKK